MEITLYIRKKPAIRETPLLHQHVIMLGNKTKLIKLRAHKTELRETSPIN